MKVYAAKPGISETLTPLVLGLATFFAFFYNGKNPLSLLILVPFLFLFCYRLLRNTKGRVLITQQNGQVVFYGVFRKLNIATVDIVKIKLKKDFVCKVLDLWLVDIQLASGSAVTIYTSSFDVYEFNEFISHNYGLAENKKTQATEGYHL